MSTRYDFRRLGCVNCKDIANAITPQLISRSALNTSFDSGRLHMPDWEQFNGLSATPPLTAEFIADWPVSHHAYCDEWWVFEGAIPQDFKVVALCNFIGTTIARKPREPGLSAWRTSAPCGSVRLRWGSGFCSCEEP